MEWAKSKIVKVPGSGKNECETRMVREWLRVMCVNRSAERGTPQSITVTRGRAPKERYKGENLKVVNDTTTLLVPVRPGTDFAASFEWTNGSDELTVAWPEGEPESARVMAFKSGTEAAAAADAAPTSSAAAPPAPAEPAALKTEPALEDVASLAATPNDEAWAAAPEARVKGSTAAGCETKTSGDWFRARCKAASVEQAFTEVVPLRGHRKTQTKAEVSGDTATLVTPYVEGTELHVRFVGKSGGQTLVLRWSKGPRPETIGAFEKGK